MRCHACDTRMSDDEARDDMDGWDRGESLCGKCLGTIERDLLNPDDILNFDK